MIIGDRKIEKISDLYDSIEADWKEHLPGKNADDEVDPRHFSFIYGYLKNIHEKRIEEISGKFYETIEGKNGQSNQYQLVCALKRGYLKGIISDRDALEYLFILFDNDKRSSGSIKKWADKICGNNSKKNAAKLIFADNDSKLDGYIDKCLYRLKNDFFRIARKRSEADDIKLLAEYTKYVEKNSGLYSGGSALSGSRLSDKTFLERCRMAYLKVCKDYKDGYAPDAYIPLGFDAASGAGIFMLGKNRTSARSVKAFVSRKIEKDIKEITNEDIRKNEKDVYIALKYFEYFYEGLQPAGNGTLYYEDPDIDTGVRDYENNISGDVVEHDSIALYDDLDEAIEDMKKFSVTFMKKYRVDNGADKIWEMIYNNEETNELSEEEKVYNDAYNKYEEDAMRKSGLC